MPINSKKGYYHESAIFTLEINEEWAIDVQWLNHGEVRTISPRIRVPYNINDEKITFLYPETLPESIKKKVVKMLKLKGAN
jgi:hypothetical protein